MELYHHCEGPACCIQYVPVFDSLPYEEKMENNDVSSGRRRDECILTKHDSIKTKAKRFQRRASTRP